MHAPKRVTVQKALTISLYVLVTFILIVIIIRAIPYSVIKTWRLPFIRLEPIMYTGAVLFIIRMALSPSQEAESFFVLPLENSGYDQLHLKKDLVICSLLFVFNLVYLAVIFDKGIPNLDEGFILTMSDRVLRGEIPHKDFFLLMTPGAIYLNAWIFRMFGETVLVERMLTLVLGSVASSVFYLLVRRGMGFFFSISATLLFTAWQFPMWFQANYSWYAMFFSLVTFWMASLTLMQGKKNGVLFLLVGFLCGVTFLFKQNTGLLTLIAVALYSPVERVLFRNQERKGLLASSGFVRDIVPLVKGFLVLLLGFSIPLATSAYFYASHGYLLEYVRDVLLIPWQNRRQFAVPYMAFSRLTDKRVMAYMPPFVILFSIGYFAKKIRGNSLELKDRFPLLLLLAAFCSFLAVFQRADFIHVIFALWPSLALMTYWVQRGVISVSKDRQVFTKTVPISRLLNSKFRSLAVVLFSLFILIFLLIHRTEKNIDLNRDLEKIEGKRGERIYGERKAVGELNEVIRFVKNYRGAGRSEQIFSTNPLIYFLTSRQNATSCDYIIIGNVGSGFENEAMEAIKSGKPCLVILDGELRNYQLFCSWGNIENCIFKHYKIALASSGGRYLILERRNEFAREIRKLEGLLADENVEFKVIRNYDPDNKRGRITLSGDARDAVILSKERPRVEFPLEISSGSGILFAVGPSAEDVKALKVALGNSDVFSVTSKPEETWQFYIHKYKGKLPFHGKPYEITCSIELLDPKEGDYVAVAMPSILSPRKNGDFNVVVFSCDALRADHLNLYGYPRNTAPNLARLAESSWTFSNAISQSSWTAPSFASVLTSTYPSENGVYRERYSDRLDALDYGWWDPSTWEVINLDCVENDYGSSLPEVLRRNGYFTKAYTFIELFSDYAVNQSFGGGFDSLEMAHQLDSGRYGKAITTQMCFDRVKSFLQDYANYKFCLFFHVKEPHTDYAPPESFARKFIDPSYKGPIGLRIGQWKVFSETYTDDDNRRIVDLYDAQINYADDILGQLIETLKSLGIYENTLLVFMSDHGEEFASDPIDAHKGRYVHGHSLRYHLIHVPLVIHLPGLSAGTKRELVQLLDVAPTLYDFLGIHVNPEHITGKSLLPLISGKTDKFRGYAISERVCYGTEKQSILEDGYQYIRTLGVPYEELYSLNPSDSNVNLAEYLPQQVAERRARLDAILNVETDKKPKGTDAKADKSKRPAEATSRTLTQRAVENLKSLGYLK